MNKLLNSIVDGLLAAIPLERIVAAGFNLLIGRIGAAPASKLVATVAHIREACAVVEGIIADGAVSPEEIKEGRVRIQELRLQLLDLWGRGEPSKDAQSALVTAETKAVWP